MDHTIRHPIQSLQYPCARASVRLRLQQGRLTNTSSARSVGYIPIPGNPFKNNWQSTPHPTACCCKCKLHSQASPSLFEWTGYLKCRVCTSETIKMPHENKSSSHLSSVPARPQQMAIRNSSHTARLPASIFRTNQSPPPSQDKKLSLTLITNQQCFAFFPSSPHSSSLPSPFFKKENQNPLQPQLACF